MPTIRPSPLASGLAIVVLVATLGWGLSRPAAACSCATGSVTDLMSWNDIGFIGTLIERPADDVGQGESDAGDGLPYRFSVDRWIHGDLEQPAITILSSFSGASCGFEVPVGKPAAIFASRSGDAYVGGLCSTMSVELALAQLEPIPAASGIAELVVLGNFAGSVAAYLDADGTFLGYGGQIDIEPSWQPASFPCQDGRHGLVSYENTFRVIELATGADAVEPTVLDGPGWMTAAACVDPNEITVIRELPSGGLTVASLDGGNEWATRVGPSGQPILAGTALVLVEYLDPGERLVAITEDGTRRQLSSLDRATTDDPYRGYASIAASPDGRVVAALEVGYVEPGRASTTLRLVEVATGATVAKRQIEAEGWTVTWFDEDRLGVAAGGPSTADLLVLDTATLETLDVVTGWLPHQTTVAGGRAWGLHESTVYRADLGTAPEAVFTLPVITWGPVLPLAEPVPRAVDDPADRDPGAGVPTDGDDDDDGAGARPLTEHSRAESAADDDGGVGSAADDDAMARDVAVWASVIVAGGGAAVAGIPAGHEAATQAEVLRTTGSS